MIAFCGLGSLLLVSLFLGVYLTVIKCEEFEYEIEAARDGSHPIWKRDVISGPGGSPVTRKELESLMKFSKGRQRLKVKEDVITGPGGSLVTRKELEDMMKNRKGRQRLKKDDEITDPVGSKDLKNLYADDPRPAARFFSYSTLEHEAAIVVLGRATCPERIAARGNAYELAYYPWKSTAVQDQETKLGDDWVAVYLHMSKDQRLVVSLWCRSLDGAVQEVSVRLEGNADVHKIQVTGTGMQEIAVPGEFPARAGYVDLRLHGNPGKVAFSHIVVKNKEPENVLTYVKPGFSYSFGRLGPSVYLKMFPQEEVELCYTEVKPDPNRTPNGTYHMALGTSGLEFGIQSFGADPRNVILKLWSDYRPDKLEAGKEIPKHLQIETVHSTAGSTVETFSHAGYGTSITHNIKWQTNTKLRFALKIKNGDHFREVTAWIAIEGKSFLKVGTLKKPTKTAPEQWKFVYSSVENFSENYGYHPRRALFGNQWCMHPSGKWEEFTKFRHTVDETGKKVRRDYRAGAGPGSDIFLEMGGFRNDPYTPVDVDITRKPSPPNYMDKLLEELAKST